MRLRCLISLGFPTQILELTLESHILIITYKTTQLILVLLISFSLTISQQHRFPRFSKESFLPSIDNLSRTEVQP